MNLMLAIGLIWLAFAAGYCLSGLLGAGTREELEREVSCLKRVQQIQCRIIELKDEQIAQLEADKREINLVNTEKSKV